MQKPGIPSQDPRPTTPPEVTMHGPDLSANSRRACSHSLACSSGVAG